MKYQILEFSSATSISERPNGNLWLSNRYQGAVRIQSDYLQDENLDTLIIDHYKEAQGLKSLAVNDLFNNYKGRLTAATVSGPYYYNSETNRFHYDSLLQKELQYFKHMNLSISDNGIDKLWINNRFDKQTAYLTFDQKGYKKLVWRPFKEISDYPLSSFFDDGKEVWFGSGTKLLHYDLNFKPIDNNLFKAIISRVRLNQDSLFLYDQIDKSAKYHLNYNANVIHFEFSSNYYIESEKNTYQYQLVNHDETWSNWSNLNHTRYTNLWEGKYTFRLRVKNYLNEVSEISQIQFSIAAPWYRSVFMYIIYLILLISIIRLIIQYRVKHLEQQKNEMQKIILSKTSDLTQKNLLLKEQSEELKELDKLKSNFFVSLSHEFKTPLTLILAPIKELLKRNVAKKQISINSDDLQIIESNANRLLSLVMQLMDLSKLDHKKLNIQLNKVDLYLLITKIINDYKHYTNAKKLSISLDASLESKIVTDVEKIQTIIRNILFNAIKFSFLGDIIQITIKIKYKHLNIYIKDKGVGIPSEKIGRIFDRFYQGDLASEDLYNGTGIGLSLSKELIELMNGKISVKSVVGQGTEFKISHPIIEGDYPLYANPPEKSDTLNETLINKNTLKTKVLIVDDNQDFLNFMAKMLQEKGYSILVASNGQEAITKIQNEKADLVITDIMMPYKDGHELCIELKSDMNTSHIPIIIITASVNQGKKLDLLSLGIEAYLTKPFDFDELFLTIESILKKREELKRKYQSVFYSDSVETIENDNSKDKEFINTVLTIIRKNLSDSSLSSETFLKELPLSRSIFYQKTKVLLNLTPNDLIRKTRLETALKMIHKNQETISEIAYKVGFNSPSYFAECFRKEFGQLPSLIMKTKTHEKV